MKKTNDVVFNILNQMLTHSPEASYVRLNGALRSTLGDCIVADLPFNPDTFSRIYNELRGGYWFGDGEGSHPGEHYYTLACKNNHNTAIQSFEAFAGRPGVLWEEQVATPDRLHVGSQFTWKGYWVTITSMRKDSLVACTYKDSSNRVDGYKVGAAIGYDPNYIITESRRDGTGYKLRIIKAPADSGSRTVARRITISYMDILEFRRSENKRVKAVIDAIAECDPVKDVKRLTKRINDEHFRHFQLEKITAAFSKRKDWIRDEGARSGAGRQLAAWRAGEGGAYLNMKGIILRVKGDLVQCSNGNSVGLAAVRRLLPLVLARKGTSGTVSLPLDGHVITRINSDGVTIGCTLIGWPEIENLKDSLL